MNDKIADVYDAFPYDSLAIKQTHPVHLYHIARLCGLDATTPSHARVLELGSASGGNLIPMAYHCPTAQFLGVDLSLKQTQNGLGIIQDLHLTNIELKHQSILDFQSTEPFDYIICHGLFSWVPKEVRSHIFALCQQYLSRNGVAYISYNTFPGWQAGNIVRELLQTQTSNIVDLSQKVIKARQVLSAYKQVLQGEHNPYIELLLSEIALVEEHSDSQLLHEHLSAYHYPLFVGDFIKQAANYQLHYLSDAFLSNDTGLSLEWMDGLQSLDILKNRRFRCTLLCHPQAGLRKAAAQSNFQLSFPDVQNVIIDERPVICPLVRYQAKGSIVTNHRHENIFLTPVAEVLIPFLDGHHDKTALTDILISQVAQGILILVDRNGDEIVQRQARYEQASKICEDTLQLFAKNALLLNEHCPK